MKSFAVDTNVGVAANGRGTHADLNCQLACVERLEQVAKNGVVAVDDSGLIFEEYRKHLRLAGQPGVGDRFVKHVHERQHSEERVRRFRITPSKDDRRGFDELPENTLDRSDRKFLAVAVVANATVLNATDSDWGKERSLIDELGVRVEELCPHHLPSPGLAAADRSDQVSKGRE